MSTQQIFLFRTQDNSQARGNNTTNNYLLSQYYCPGFVQIKLIAKSYKTIYYQVHFLTTAQKVQIKFVDMTHVFWVHHEDINNFQFRITKQESLILYSLISQQSSFQKSECSEHNQISQTLPEKNQITLFQRLLIKISLQKIHGQGILQESNKYFYNADGVLYNNVCIYLKPVQFRLKALSKLGKTKIMNQLLDLHYRKILLRTQICLSSIRLVQQKSEDSGDLEQTYKSFSPILAMQPELKFMVSSDPMACLQFAKSSNEEEKKLAQLLLSIPQQKNCRCEKNVGDLQQHGTENIKKSNYSEKVIKKIIRSLEIPRFYSLAQACIYWDQFEEEVKKIKTLCNQLEEFSWLRQKFQQICMFNKKVIKLERPRIHRGFSEDRNGSKSIEKKDEKSSQKNHSEGRNNYKSKNQPKQNTFLNRPLKNMKNPEFQLLQQEKKLLQQQSFKSNPEYLDKLGWGQLIIKHCYSSKTTQPKKYLKAMEKYIQKLKYYCQFPKIRKIYHFYRAKVFQLKGRNQEAKFQLKNALRIIVRSSVIREEFITDLSKKQIAEISAIYHQLGRLYHETKKYFRAFKFFQESLKLKHKVYGSYSKQLLPTLYNIIYLLQKQELALQEKQKFLYSYVEILGAIKQRLIESKIYQQWLNLISIKESQIFMTNVQRQLSHFQLNNLTHQQPYLIGNKMHINLVKTNIFGNPLQNLERKYRQEDTIIIQKGLKNEENLIINLFQYLTLINQQQESVKKLRLKQLILKINEYSISNMQSRSIINLLILKIYSSFYMRQENSSLLYIQQLKKLVSHAQQKQNSQYKTGFIQIIIELIFHFYTVLSIDKLKQSDFDWIIKKYYVYGSHYERQRIKSLPIIDLLYYCLILKQFFQDYSHIYYILNVYRPKNQLEQLLSNCFSQNTLIYLYLQSYTYFNLRKYGQAITLIEVLLKNMSQVSKQDLNFKLRQIKIFVWKNQLVSMLLISYFQKQMFGEFYEMFQNTNICKESSGFPQDQKMNVVKKALCVYEYLFIQKRGEGALSIQHFENDDCISIVDTANLQVEGVCVKILKHHKKQLLMYITVGLNEAQNRLSNSSEQKISHNLLTFLFESIKILSDLSEQNIWNDEYLAILYRVYYFIFQQSNQKNLHIEVSQGENRIDFIPQLILFIQRILQKTLDKSKEFLSNTICFQFQTIREAIRSWIPKIVQCIQFHQNHRRILKSKSTSINKQIIQVFLILRQWFFLPQQNFQLQALFCLFISKNRKSLSLINQIYFEGIFDKFIEIFAVQNKGKQFQIPSTFTQLKLRPYLEPISKELFQLRSEWWGYLTEKNEIISQGAQDCLPELIETLILKIRNFEVELTNFLPGQLMEMFKEKNIYPLYKQLQDW